MTERTCVVTGAASGIGAAVAESFRASGHTVIGVDVAGGDVHADLSRPDGRRFAVEQLTRRAAAVDVVVACAGLARPEPVTLSVNYFGVVDLLAGLLPLLRRGRSPRVVVVSSVAAVHRTLDSLVQACLDHDEEAALDLGRRAVEAGKGIGIYAASKQALARWVRRTAPTEAWAGHGIALNAVGPGVVLTPMIAAEWASPAGREALSRQVPMPLTRGPIDVGQIVRTVRFLADPDNTAVTGQTVYVDGGADAQLRGDRQW
ncbi:MAG TPA: SDR family oxidoreductase [Thermobifida alba]|nr:SDR family oxidoreductase [Thermobifida alba]